MTANERKTSALQAIALALFLVVLGTVNRSLILFGLAEITLCFALMILTTSD